VVWVCAGLFTLAFWFLPASALVRSFPIQEGGSLGTPLALTLLVIFPVALIISAFLIFAGLRLYKPWQNPPANTSVAGNGAENAQPGYPGKVAVAMLALSLILLARAFHKFYWFMVWDSTGDGLGYLWLLIPVLVALCATAFLAVMLPENRKWPAFFYLMLIPGMILIANRAQSVNFHHLTQERAARIDRAIVRYYAREARYPIHLQDLTPWYLLTIPEPLIIYGQDWCYDAGEQYYRLGYIDRQHWSAPHLIGRTYQATGLLPELHGICEQEALAWQERHPDFPYQYWVEAK
jgi:hypothetical protein